MSASVVECGVKSTDRGITCEMFEKVRQPSFQTALQTNDGPSYCWSKPDKSDILKTSDGAVDYYAPAWGG